MRNHQKSELTKVFSRVKFTQIKIFTFDFKILKRTPHTPVAQKLADDVGFRRFQGVEVEFF